MPLTSIIALLTCQGFSQVNLEGGLEIAQWWSLEILLERKAEISFSCCLFLYIFQFSY